MCECRLTSFRLLRCPHGLTRRHEATKRKRPQSCRKTGVSHRGTRTQRGSVVATAVLCRFGAGPRITQIHANRKNRVGSPRRGDPSFRRERAVYEILPQSRQGAEIETKNCSRPTLLGRRFQPPPTSYLMCEPLGLNILNVNMF